MTTTMRPAPGLLWAGPHRTDDPPCLHHPRGPESPHPGARRPVRARLDTPADQRPGVDDLGVRRRGGHPDGSPLRLVRRRRPWGRPQTLAVKAFGTEGTSGFSRRSCTSRSTAGGYSVGLPLYEETYEHEVRAFRDIVRGDDEPVSDLDAAADAAEILHCRRAGGVQGDHPWPRRPAMTRDRPWSGRTAEDAVPAAGIGGAGGPATFPAGGAACSSQTRARCGCCTGCARPENCRSTCGSARRGNATRPPFRRVVLTQGRPDGHIDRGVRDARAARSSARPRRGKVIPAVTPAGRTPISTTTARWAPQPASSSACEPCSGPAPLVT